LADGAILPESARESVEKAAGAVIPGRLPVVPLRKQAPMILVMCGALSVFGFTLVAQTANCSRAAKEISALTRQIKEIRLDSEALRKEISELESGERIAREAVFTLGMVDPPGTLRYVTPPEIPRGEDPPAVQARSESWVTIALRALGGF
jgi:cell division protein FtsB